MRKRWQEEVVIEGKGELAALSWPDDKQRAAAAAAAYYLGPNRSDKSTTRTIALGLEQVSAPDKSYPIKLETSLLLSGFLIYSGD